jgi:hypothetical protein
MEKQREWMKIVRMDKEKRIWMERQIDWMEIERTDGETKRLNREVENKREKYERLKRSEMERE